MKDEGIEALKKQLNDLNQELEERKRSIAKKRMEIIREESDLIYTRECARKVAELLEQKLAANDIASSLDYSRDKEVERYRGAMAESMESIEHEEPIPYKSITDLK